MRALLILAAAAFALSSCQTTEIDTALQKSLPKACDALETAYSGFTLIAATGRFSAKTVAKVDAAHDGVAILCVSPSQVTAADALIRVLSASAVVAAALREAKEG